MPKIIIYSTANCPYCVRAKQLLDAKHAAYVELRIDMDPHLKDEMVAKSGRRTVPQIFIDGVPIGGFDDMAALDKQGKLNELLKGKSNDK